MKRGPKPHLISADWGDAAPVDEQPGAGKCGVRRLGEVHEQVEGASPEIRGVGMVRRRLGLGHVLDLALKFDRFGLTFTQAGSGRERRAEWMAPEMQHSGARENEDQRGVPQGPEDGVRGRPGAQSQTDFWRERALITEEDAQGGA